MFLEGAAEANAAKIYWSILSDTAIYRADLDGSNKELLLHSGGGAAEDIAIDPIRGRLYWASPADGGIMSADVNGSDAELLIPFGSPPDGSPDSYGTSPQFVSYNAHRNRLFWTSNGDRHEIWRYDFADKTSHVVVDDSRITSVIDALEVDATGDYLYWINRIPGEVRRTRVADGTTESILNSAALDFILRPTALAIDSDSGSVFVSHLGRSTSAIVRVGVTGTDPTVIVSSQEVEQPWAIVYDPVGQRLYWSNSNRNLLIYSVDRNGEDVKFAFDPKPLSGGFIEHMAILNCPVPEPSCLSSAIPAVAGVSWIMNARCKRHSAPGTAAGSPSSAKRVHGLDGQNTRPLRH